LKCYYANQFTQNSKRICWKFIKGRYFAENTIFQQWDTKNEERVTGIRNQKAQRIVWNKNEIWNWRKNLDGRKGIRDRNEHSWLSRYRRNEFKKLDLKPIKRNWYERKIKARKLLLSKVKRKRRTRKTIER